jgi:hypothetical protein
MAEETVDQFLGRRERELIAQISALRGQLAPKEAELAHVQHMRSFLPGGSNAPKVDGLSALARALAVNSPLTFGSDPFGGPDLTIGASQPSPSIVEILYGTKTIKELTIQALLDHFPLGATAAAIREFIQDAYSRTIEPGSLRAQMHRLKADKILQHDAAKDIWDFAMGKRALYDTYRQTPSTKVVPELQDENSEDDDESPLLKAARSLAWDGDGSAEKQASNNPPENKAPGEIKRRKV